ncbi:uncharacterized protein LOC143341187 [Colletes latitarsis]|uniref:uncharacterized protein LOC143341187 n=1 Tax=Colletes latitarsis TaxID=2605962 RepID=UPI0040375D9D
MASGSTEDIGHVDKLHGVEDYQTWKFEMTILFKAYELTKIVNHPAAEENKTGDWLKKDVNAQKVIVKTVDRKPLMHLLNCTTSHGMWKKLKSLYERESQEQKCKLMNEFFTYKYERDADMETHIGGLENIVYKLKELKADITKKMLISKILTTLPENYRNFMTAWESMTRPEKTLKNLMARLLMEEQRNNTDKDEPQAFKTTLRCFNCEKVGHKAKYCKTKLERGPKSQKNEQIVLMGNKMENGLYKVEMKLEKTQVTNLVTNKSDEAQLWHRRMAHMNKESLKQLLQLSSGINISKKDIETTQDICETCVKSKQIRTSFNNERTRAKGPLEILHTDLCGPIDPTTWNVYLIESRSEVSDILKQHVKRRERDKDRRIKKIRCVNGREFVNNEIKMWSDQKRIEMDTTTPYTPQLNGKVERINRTIMEKARSLIFDSGLCKTM